MRRYINFKEIKNIEKSELNKYRYYFNFICWLISDELTIENKYEKLKI